MQSRADRISSFASDYPSRHKSKRLHRILRLTPQQAASTLSPPPSESWHASRLARIRLALFPGGAGGRRGGGKEDVQKRTEERILPNESRLVCKLPSSCFIPPSITMGNCFSSPENLKPNQLTEKEFGTSVSDEEGQASPKTIQYMVETVKKLATAMDGVAGFIPVPLLPELVKVAITVLEACEDVTAVEDSVKDLQNRIFSLSVIFIEEVCGKDSEDLQGRIKKLQSTLSIILKDPDKIKGQNKIILAIFRNLNKETVDKCHHRVDEALEQFHAPHEIHLEDFVQDILSKYLDANNQLRLDVNNQLSDMSHQLEGLTQAVQNINRPHHAPTILPRQGRPPAYRVYGRDEFVDGIATLLAHEESPRVCITGAGGMGKTSVALAVMERAIVNEVFPKEYQFWVPCVEATSPNSLLRILYTQLRVTAESYDSVDILISELDASKQRRVLLFDNFETPCFSGDDANREAVRGIIYRLASLSHVALLVTMTSDFPPSEDIVWQNKALPPLDPAAARDTFQSVCQGTADEKLDELLEAIGHIPFAITLMAADAKRSQASPQDLLGEWERAGTAMNSKMDRTISLSVNRDIMKSNPAAFTLLAILSLLPAGTTGNSLRWWAPGVSSPIDAIGTLRTAALIEQEDGKFATARISVRPTVQAYMAQHDRIPADVRQQVHDTCYNYVLAHKSIPDDAEFKDDLSALANEATNLQGLLMQIKAETLRPHALDALIAFSMYQYWSKPSTVVALHALEVASALRDDPHVADTHVAVRHVAEAHQCLGKLFLELDDYDKACQHFEDACRDFKSLPGGSDRLHLGECSMALAGTWRFMNKPAQEIELLVLEGQADLSHDESNKYHVARGLFGLGKFLWYNHQHEQALAILSSAMATFEELDSPASTSACLFYMAQTYARQRKPTEALAIAKQALEKGEQAGSLRTIADILNITAKYLIGLSLHDEAFAIIERALQTYQVLGSLIGIAQMLELLGYTCAAKMDLAGARVAYEGARVQFGKVQSRKGEAGKATCTYNLRELDGMQALDQTGLSRLKKPPRM
ncbi:hypothetical protein FB451DRAFT_1554365 [Mycena latifolia]|nr:hypothetical protein FB451DRAFT_1554365 [Mycena latifolia]